MPEVDIRGSGLLPFQWKKSRSMGRCFPLKRKLTAMVLDDGLRSGLHVYRLSTRDEKS
jgi:hypothetical protein